MVSSYRSSTNFSWVDRLSTDPWDLGCHTLVEKLKFEKESQVKAIENVLVKFYTFTFPMDFLKGI